MAYARDSLLMHEAIAAGQDFSAFVRQPPERFPGLLSWHNYLSFLPDGDEAAYADRFELVGLTGELLLSTQVLCRRLGWEVPQSIPFVNETDRKAVSAGDVPAADKDVILARTAFEWRFYDEARRRFDKAARPV
jgi:hypothetical protein